MKPSEPPNRDRLLKVVAARLDGADAARESLGGIVRSIMDSVNPHQRSDAAHRDDRSPRNPVPLGEVAAYIDGTITDPNVEQRITNEAVADEGLMLEIVMAIKSKAETSSEVRQGVPNSLRSRLIGMGSSIKEVDPLDAVLPQIETSESLEPTQPVTTIQVRSDIEPRTQSPRNAPRNASWKPFAMMSLAVAAGLLVFVSWRVLTGSDGSKIAEDPDPVPGAPEPRSTDDPETMLVEDASPIPDVDPSPIPQLEPDMDSEPQTPDPLVSPPTQPMIVEVPPIPMPDQPAPEPSKNQSARPLIATWQQIDGLFLRSDLTRAAEASLAPNTSPKNILSGSELTFVSESAETRMRLETLPLCRAEGQLSEGGKLVVADDTRVEVTRGGAIDLRYGAIALLDVGRETVLRLGSNLRASVAVRTPEGSSLVVRRTSAGMEFDVLDQPVRIEDQTFVNQTVHLNPLTKETTAKDDALERLPKWTRERTQRIELPRTVLAQLSQSEDVARTMGQLIQSGNLRGESSLLLRRWLVASRRDYLMRLIASDDPLIRETALTYLRETRPNDPRHGDLWRVLRAKSQNVRSFGLVRSLFADYWAGKRPAANRRDGLVMMLAANDKSMRVTGDYLLRTFYGKGPPFIMNANARTQQRLIGNWRVIIARVEGN